MRNMLLATCVGVVSLVSTAHGEIDYLSEIYGDGVHAFYAGDLIQAQEFFDQAIRHGYKDPRCYYYRALVHMSACRDYDPSKISGSARSTSSKDEERTMWARR